MDFIEVFVIFLFNIPFIKGRIHVVEMSQRDINVVYTANNTEKNI